MKGQLNIESLYAYVVRDTDGTEGVIGITTPMGWMPLVGADMDRIKSFERHAQETANALKKPVSLVHFSVREDLHVLTPNRLSKTEGVRIDESTMFITGENEDDSTKSQ